MFPSLQSEVRDRFSAIDEFFRSSRHSPQEVEQLSRGLVFVQLYAVYEYAVRTVTQYSIEQIALCGHRFRDLRASLLAIFLDPQLRAAHDCGPNHSWEKRLELFELGLSRERIGAVTAIPHDGTHFRHTQLLLIFRTLGIARTPTLRKRHLYLIDEVVDNRNAVAHGTESPVAVGRRYTRSEVARKISVMRKICLRLLVLASDHCAHPERHGR